MISLLKIDLLGGIDAGLFISSFIAACFGILLVLLMGTTLREPSSPNSPNKFSWKYLWNDNLKRILANLIAVLATLRFMPELIGKDLNMFTGFCVGLAWDSILFFIKQKTTWLDPKPKE